MISLPATAAEIDTDLLEKFVLDQQNLKLSDGSINRSLAALRRMFRIAKKQGKLRNGPSFPEALPHKFRGVCAVRNPGRYVTGVSAGAAGPWFFYRYETFGN